MSTKRPVRRRQQLVIEPLNWVAPDAHEEQTDMRVEQDEQHEENQKTAKS